MLCYINLFAISVQFKKQLSLSSLQWIKYITMQNVRFFMGGSSFVSFEYNKIPCEIQQQLLKILFLMLLTNMSTIHSNITLLSTISYMSSSFETTLVCKQIF